MRLLPLIFLSIFLFSAQQLLAQTNLNSKENHLLDLVMERLTETGETGTDFSDLQTQLETFMLNKINLNKATAMDLAQLHFLTTTQIAAILQHRKQYGPLLSIFELQAVKGLDIQSCEMLSCFVTLNETSLADYAKPLDILKGGKQEFIYLHEQELQKRKGYINTEQGLSSGYLGSPYREVLRYRFSFGTRLVFGYSAEKDMGEKFGTSPASFFDFNAFYLFYRTKGLLKSLAIGDFQANFGCGLTFGSGMASRKSAMVLNAGNLYETLRPYRSVNESGFLKGAAVTLKKKNLELTIIASSQKISSGLKPDSLSSEAFVISSVSLSGLHRTAKEMEQKNNSSQQIGGLNLEYIKPNYRIGGVLILSQFNLDLAAKKNPYQVLNKAQSRTGNAGIYAQGQIRNILLLGEISHSSNGAYAALAESLIPLHAKADILVLYRNYSPAYQAPFANAFSEYGGCNNEQGFYVALSIKPKSSVQINLYADIFNSPWLRYLVNAPSKGEEYMLNLNYSVSKSLQIECRYKYELKNKNLRSDLNKLDYLGENKRQQFRFNLQYMLTRELSFKTRMEQVLFDKASQTTQTGTLFFQDVHAKLLRSKLSLAARFSWFDIDNYEARVYATESDVLYNYSIPQFQNRGWRIYFLISYKLTKKMDVYLKMGQTNYTHVNTIGTGLDQINGNKLQELNLQVRVIL